jgi:paraquat-inducible protein B
MSKPANPTLIGGFVLGALALAIALALVFGAERLFRRQTAVVMYFEGSISGLSVGAPVSFRGVRIGQVSDVFIRYDRSNDQVVIPVFAEIDPREVTMVGMEAAPEDGVPIMKRLVDRGLRAQLAVPSLVTGQMAVQLDFFPDAPVSVVGLDPDRFEIPTVPSALQEVESTVQTIVDRLMKLPMEQLVAELRSVLQGAGRVVNDPALVDIVTSTKATMTDMRQLVATLNGQVAAMTGSFRATSGEAQATLKELQRTLTEAQQALATVERTTAQAGQLLVTTKGVIEPGSALHHELISTLRETSAAARSLRGVADTLQRDPNSVVFGRSAPSGR